jgi:23S rRNA U2552 (ribose-2'-O)-methylase RlmE/FtsJ
MGKFSKDKRDIYYRLSKELGWRARSVWKLYAIDEQLQLLKNCKRVVDLCAAPGGWSQLLAVRLLKNVSTTISSTSFITLGTNENNEEDESKECRLHNHKDISIIAVDLAAMLPIHGVRILQADITHFQTAPNIIHELGEKYADLVLCDGAPDVIGVHDVDESIQLELLCAVSSTSF